MSQNQSLSTQEVADMLHVSKSTIYDLIRKGEIHSYKIGRKVRFTQDDVDAYIARSRHENSTRPVQRIDTHSTLLTPEDPEGPELIIAGQMAELGLSVTLVERGPVCGGMARNRKCLSRFPIRLLCGTTLDEVFGENTLEGVSLTDGTYLPCKTLLIAAGLRPDRELIFGLGQPDWLHICGNCRTVHPMVEAVVNEGTQAGIAAWEKKRGCL